MGNYLRPDVYVEQVPTSNMPIQAVSTSIGGFVGITPRGKIGVATLVTSWNDFCLKFARGLTSPFLTNSYLSYAVYGFFQNGGTTCYVTRVATGATSANIVVPLSTGVKFTAKEEGTWANTLLKVEVKSSKVAQKLDVVVTYNNVVVETFTALPSTGFESSINDVSNFVTVELGKTLAVGTGTLTGGTDGTALIDADYLGTNGLQSFNTITDVNLLAIPGQTSNAVLQGLLDYCAGRGDVFAILDTPIDTDSTEAQALADAVTGDLGAVYYPWGNVVDPLSKIGKLKLVPPSGHVMGIYARTDRERGVHKAPAGISSVVRGFVSLERTLAPSDVDVLNPIGINCIVAKPNIGIVVWGARTTSSDSSKIYVSDVRLDIKIRVSTYNGTQWAVFEPNDSDLWIRLQGSLSAFMYSLWLEGALKGETPDLAFYVKCDEELNPTELQNQGKVVSEVGYATKKPGEFIIIRLSQNSMSSQA